MKSMKGVMLVCAVTMVFGLSSGGCGGLGGLILLANIAGSHHSGNSNIFVDVQPRTAVVAPSATAQFTATVTGTSNQAVTWTISDPNRGSVSPTGLYTATATGGRNFVIATSVADRLSSFAAEINP